MRSESTLARALRLPAIALAGILFATGAFAAPPKPAAAPKPEAAKPAAPQPLTAETLWKLARLGAPTISPDGAAAVVAVTRYDLEKDKGLTDLWLVPTAGGEARQLTTHEAADSSPLWSPDGNWIAFSSQRDGDDAPQLYLLPVAGGEARRLTQVPTGAGAAKWFPDSSRLAFTTRIWEDLPNWEDQGKRLKERKESKVSARVWDRPPVTSWDHFVDDRKAHLYSIAIAGGEPVAITRGSGYSLGAEGSSFDISPDGAEVAFTTDIDPTGVDSNHDVFVIPATGGTARNLTADNPASDGHPLYSPDGRYLAFSRQTIKGFYADRARLVLHDRAAGTNRVLTDAWDRSVDGLVWTPDSTALYGAIDDAGTIRIYRIDATSGAPAPLTAERSFSDLALAADGKTLVAIRQSFVEPPTLVRVDPATGAATQISTFNDELLAGVEWGTYESVTYTGARGEPVQMWVNYPPGFDHAKKYPLYLILHGGPHSGIPDAWQPRWNAQIFAGWGYVSAWHNFHGSSGFGQEFTDSINPLQSELPYEDTILAAKWFAAQPWIDADRMAAGGGSFGGYLASVLLGREHPFKTLIAHAAVYNWYTQYGADYGAGKRREGEFWEKPEIWQTSSPHFAAGNFRTPTLVIHGQLDQRVPVNHGIELFHTLQNQGVKSRLVYFPDENHWILKPNNSLFWYSTCKEWLAEYLDRKP